MGAQGLWGFAVAPFAFLEVDGEGGLAHAVELGQAPLHVAPECLDPIDVGFAVGEALALVDAHVLVVADRDQAVVAAPAVTMNHALRIDPTPDDGQEAGRRAIGHHLGVDAPVALEDPKHRLA